MAGQVTVTTETGINLNTVAEQVTITTETGINLNTVAEQVTITAETGTGLEIKMTSTTIVKLENGVIQTARYAIAAHRITGFRVEGIPGSRINSRIFH